MENKKISVIIPVYKTESYLQRCIKSVTGQTYKNLEIILVDDGSPDICGDICDDYKAEDDRIKVIHKRNGGVSSARNAGLDSADGEFIMFVDSDDELTHDACEKTIEMYSSGDYGLIACEYFIYKKTGALKNSTYENDAVFSGKSDIEKLQLDIINNNVASRKHINVFLSCCCKLYRKDIVAGQRFDGSLSVGEDAAFNIVYLEKCKSILYNKTYVYNYYLNENSATGGYNPDYITGIYALNDWLEIYLQESSKGEGFIEKARICYNERAVSTLMYYFQECKLSEYRQRLRIVKPLLDMSRIKNPSKHLLKSDGKTKILLFFYRLRIYFPLWIYKRLKEHS